MADWHKGFDFPTVVEHFVESEKTADMDMGEIEDLYNLLDDYYGEDWLLDLDFEDDEFWDLFRDLYDHAKQ